ncbi:response regulator transcription factor [Nocardiopsis sp. JB363]|uniref:response regulator transcription factor n=1 Tax=Nocardiopsis sp. JB363 TaxID=1434837 RepID=UPI000B34D5F5|nr:response regulator transcription factor [Nocardiopsis sp. JB363]
MRIVLADDSVLLRSGIVRLLEDEGLSVVASVGDAAAAVDAVTDHRPDLAILDVRMPPTYTDEGIIASLDIRKRYPETAVLLLSQWIEEESAGELLARSTKGVGYLLKDRVTDISTFLDTIGRVARGGSALDPEVVSQILKRGREEQILDRLSPRENDVLAAMAEGCSNASITTRLRLSERAVEKHIRGIFTKLDLPPEETDQHRRVAAVLTFLKTHGFGPDQALGRPTRG